MRVKIVTTSYARMISAQINAMRRSMGALVGIAEGMLCDGSLNDAEIRHLRDWFINNEQLSSAWPGDVIYDKVKEVLRDGIVTEEERAHLVKVLNDLIGTSIHDLKLATPATSLAYDPVDRIAFPNNRFCLTGDFIHGSRKTCELEIEERGGVTTSSITKTLNYLIIGSLGSIEWKHGSFGLKVEKAMQYKRDGSPIVIVQETVWKTAL
jgi:NAD-dependent DNA ligase